MAPRILIAEDDEVQGVALRTVLEQRGYQAEIVGDGLEAVRKLCVGDYDLALLDYQMPDVDGLVAARLIHGFLQNEDRPRLIALTAAAEGLQEKAAVSGGTPFDAVVSKDQGYPVLLDAIDISLCSATARRIALAARDAEAARERHRRAPFAALPFLVMVAALAGAFAWTSAPLPQMDSVAPSVQAANNVGIAMFVLAAAALYGLWHAAEAVRRRWSSDGPVEPPRAARVWHEVARPLADGPWCVAKLLRQKI